MKAFWKSKTLYTCGLALIIGVVEQVQTILPEYIESSQVLIVCGIVIGIARVFKSNLGLK